LSQPQKSDQLQQLRAQAERLRREAGMSVPGESLAALSEGALRAVVRDAHRELRRLKTRGEYLDYLESLIT
jgi:hypothetical protein